MSAAVYGTAAMLPGLGMLSSASAQTSSWLADIPSRNESSQQLAIDEHYWQAVRKLYELPADVIHLEHGNWGMMARPVLEQYINNIEQVNRDTSYYSRISYVADHQRVMQQLAGTLGVDAEELVPVRNATEALTVLISGYNRLQPGDSVLYADVDYSSMQGLMDSLQERRGVTVKKLALPEPASHASILQTYEDALKADRRIRLLLLTHVSHRNGLLMPVQALTELARRYDADVIVDSAHAWGQIDFRLPELAADFVGLNLHKWIGAPLGLGLMYVSKSRFADIDRHFVHGGGHGSEQFLADRTGVGTFNLAAMLSVPIALDVHARIGAAHKQERLRFLRDRWVKPLRQDERFEILTPDEPGLYAGITSFRLRGQSDEKRNTELAKRLLDEFGVFTVQRNGLASGACVRVTPAPFTGTDEIDALVEALQSIA